MKVAISTQWNNDFREIAELTLPSIQSYCLKHGYSLYAHHCEQSSPDIVWQRIDDIKSLLFQFDLVVHLDADTLITNPHITIESIIGSETATDLFLGSDWNGINDGFSAWRNAEQSWLVLGAMRGARSMGYTSPQDYITRGLRPREINAETLSQRMVNSYKTEEYGDLRERYEWHPKDFLLHLPGIGNHRRVEILKEVLSQLKP